MYVPERIVEASSHPDFQAGYDDGLERVEMKSGSFRYRLGYEEGEIISRSDVWHLSYAELEVILGTKSI